MHPSQSICPDYEKKGGTASQKISLKANPTPTIIVMGKNRTANRHSQPSISESSSKENPNIPAKMLTSVTPITAIRSFEMKSSSMSRRNISRSRNFRGTFKIEAQH